MANVRTYPRRGVGAASSGLVCRIRQKVPGERRRAAAGEVELENTSTTVLDIEYDMSPLQYLDLVVSDAAGRVVSKGHYGDCFSPMAQAVRRQMKPGEKLIGDVSLLGNVPPEARVPGEYVVQAIFEYGAVRAVSDPIRIAVDES
jgi:hypothetical protein